MSHTAEIPLAPGSESPLELKPLKAADPASVYLRRAKRLEVLAKDSPLADYLELCRRLVAVQAKLAAKEDFGLPPAWDKSEGEPSPTWVPAPTAIGRAYCSSCSVNSCRRWMSRSPGCCVF